MTPDEIRGRLAELGAMQARSDRAAGSIADAARSLRQTVQARMDHLRPSVLTDEAAAEEYQRLTEERGRIDRVLGQSHS